MDKEKNGNPLLRMYGITLEGHSVCFLIEDFHPYFYVRMPPNFLPSYIPQFYEFLAKKIKENNFADKQIRDLSICQKTNIYNYSDSPKVIFSLRDMFEHGFEFNGCHFEKMTYESKVNFPLRYMIDRDIVGMSWITLPEQKYTLRRNKVNYCQIEAEISYFDIVSHAPEGDFARIAPIRILSLDIECAASQ